MSDKKGLIALKVFAGDLSSNMKDAEVVSVGILPDYLSPITPILVREPKVWILRHTLDYNVYEYHDTTRGEKCVIHIIVAIAAKAKMKGSNPFILLKQIAELTQKQIINEGSISLSNVDNSQFEEIINNCELEDQPQLLPRMDGNIPASLKVDNEERVKMLMEFSRYQVLKHYSHLEMGFNCESTISLKGGTAGNKPIKSTIKRKEPDAGGTPASVAKKPSEINTGVNNVANIISGSHGGRSGGVSLEGGQTSSYGGGVSLEDNGNVWQNIGNTPSSGNSNYRDTNGKPIKPGKVFLWILFIIIGLSCLVYAISSGDGSKDEFYLESEVDTIVDIDDVDTAAWAAAEVDSVVTDINRISLERNKPSPPAKPSPTAKPNKVTKSESSLERNKQIGTTSESSNGNDKKERKHHRKRKHRR